MSYKLEKPYTNNQRADFICEHQGLNYYEDDNCIIMYANTEKIVNGEAVSRINDDDYKAELKKQQIQQATATRNSKYDNITNSVILDQLTITNLDLQLAAGTITQAQHDAQKTIYNNRISAKAALFVNATDEFYTVTGLTKPTITQ